MLDLDREIMRLELEEVEFAKAAIHFSYFNTPASYEYLKRADTSRRLLKIFKAMNDGALKRANP